MPIFSPTVITMRFQPTIVPRLKARATATLTHDGMYLVDLSRKPLYTLEISDVARVHARTEPGEQPQRLARKVHLVANIGLHAGRHAAQGSVAHGFIADVHYHVLQRNDG